MSDPGQRGTNADDSAPGVNDGPARAAPPPRAVWPPGRRAVWFAVVIVALVLVAIFANRPMGWGERTQRDAFQDLSQTRAEIARSKVPGTADRLPPEQRR